MGCALLVAAVFGVTTASAEQSLGPHEARYAVTTDDVVTLDLGPLGTVEIPSPLPLTLGVRITVKEIPAAVTAVDPASTVQTLGRDLQGYVQFFTGPRAALENAAWALVADAVRRTVLAFLGLLLAAAGLAVLLGPVRRRELAARAARYRPQAGRTAAITLVVAVTCVSSLDRAVRQDADRYSSSVFAGTPLDGARITGRLAGVIDTYGSMVVDAYRTNEAFYDGAREAVAQAWDQRALTLAVTEDDGLGPVPGGAGVDGVPYPAGVDPEEAGAADSTGAAVDAGTTGSLHGADEGAGILGPSAVRSEPLDPVVMVLVSDLHCNVGMARVVRTVAERSGADIVLNAGDTTVNGTSVEQYCVTSLSQAVPPGVERVVADGNHDSLETEEQERAAGWTVLDGQVVTVGGIRVLGDRDPNRTEIGGGTRPVSTESVAEAGERLAQVACDAGGVDVLLVHTPRVGDPAMETGCVAVQLSGHQHRRSGPVPVGRGVRYVSSTTAGATSGGATVGPLNGVADITVLRFDPDRGRMIDLQVVQVMPDGSAVVGPREPFPTPQPVDPPAQGDGTAGGQAEPGGAVDGTAGGQVPGPDATDPPATDRPATAPSAAAAPARPAGRTLSPAR